jgi:RNA polymerase sigma factor (sigma-70 family)
VPDAVIDTPGGPEAGTDQRRRGGPRPSRAQVEPVALRLLSRHSAVLLATARRYSLTPEDAEDAYQRGVEILLTKAPTAREDELLPWLKTVVKHEAFAVRKASGRAIPSEEAGQNEPDVVGWTDEHAERYERLRLGAEAMAKLKPQEIRCLLLKAEGLSYQEISAVTGFSYTKVNRCLTEGRRAFMDRVARIESGAECERLAPLMSKIADGEAGADEMRAVRPHLKGCLACKATLREYRAAPARLAGLVPPVVALADGGVEAGGFIGRVLQAMQDKIGIVTELAMANKAAAVAASTVALAGGGAAGVEVLKPHLPAAKPTASKTVRPKAPRRQATTTAGTANASAVPSARMGMRAATRAVSGPNTTPRTAPTSEFGPDGVAAAGGGQARAATPAVAARPVPEQRPRSTARPTSPAPPEFGP